MFGGVKITLILSATMIVCCVLFISYNEYTNRYSLLTTNENSVYIFDKKSTVLNKCNSKGCSVIETKLPTQMAMTFSTATSPTFQQSKMFDSNQPMTKEVKEKIQEQTKDDTKSVQNNKPVEAKSINDKKKEVEKKMEADKKTEEKNDDEFVE